MAILEHSGSSGHGEGDITQQLWSLITQLGEQLSQNQSMSVALYTLAGKVKHQTANLQTGFVLRRFNSDKTQEEYDAALEQMNTTMGAENQALANDNRQLSNLIKEYEQTLETLMSTFRTRAQSVQERELSLIRDFEAKLLAREEENGDRELQAHSAISVAIVRLSYLLRRLLRAQGGEDVDPPPSPADEAAEREPWTAAQAAHHALEREIELARLEKENEELRRMLGMLPSNPPTRSSSEHQPSFHHHQGQGSLAQGGAFQQHSHADKSSGVMSSGYGQTY